MKCNTEEFLTVTEHGKSYVRENLSIEIDKKGRNITKKLTHEYSECWKFILRKSEFIIRKSGVYTPKIGCLY